MKSVDTATADLEELMNDLEAMLVEQGKMPDPNPPEAQLPPNPAEKPVQVAPEVVEPTVIIAEPEAVPEVEDEHEEVAPVEPPSGGSGSPSSVYAGPVGSKGSLKHFINVADFQLETQISEATLDDALMRQSGMRAFYGAQAAYAEGQAATIKAKFDILEARIYDETRKKLAATTEKVTEKAVENAVKLDPRWLAGKMQVIEAGTIADVNKGLTFAMADRRDMLIQLCSDRRKDMDGQIRISAQTMEKEMLADRARSAVATSRGGYQ